MLGSGDWSAFGGRPDLILWTRTGWPWPNPDHVRAQQVRMLQEADALRVPVVGYHLDIWWGLKREHQVFEEPFFQSDLLVTADGGHDDRWAEAAVNHVWFPPAVSAREAIPGRKVDRFTSRLAFVGSWQGGYHDEHQHRFELVAFLKKHFRSTCEFYPRIGEHAIRGADLRDLYASVDLAIGDSCFAGTGLANYWSDRIPETLGRRGLLAHPNIPGLEQHFVELDYEEPVTYDCGHLFTWDAGDWDQLGELIEWVLRSPDDELDAVRDRAWQHVLQHHTYDVRMDQLVDLLLERGML